MYKIKHISDIMQGVVCVESYEARLFRRTSTSERRDEEWENTSLEQLWQEGQDITASSGY